LAVMVTAAGRRAESEELEIPSETFELLPASDLSLGQVQASPRNVLLAVRNRGTLAHVAAAFQDAGNRDVVVMTARVLGVDEDGDTAAGGEPTVGDRGLLCDGGLLGHR